ncbi:MAG TPA: flagellin [Polyangiaceae bacterium]|jgi:flagellin|nr:flagellin [Polyangiaceae bacterium]
MSIDIQTNYAALSAQKNLNSNQSMLAGSFQKLSSGFRVNSAADDAAGLAISESMKSDIRSYTVAARNAGDAQSMAQTAEGALGDIHDVLGRMRELATQSSNGDLDSTDRSYIETEFSSLQAEVSRTQQSTKFNGVNLINTTASNVTFQVGLDNTASDQITLTFGGVGLNNITTTTVSLATATGALNALTTIDTAIQDVSTARAKFGTAMNRMDVATNNINTMSLNLTAANSRIVDVDVASETANLSRNQVLVQAGAAVLAQANQIPQLALKLLQ